jgi:hypothetical protein
MIKNILSVSGKSGLYKLVSRSKSMLIIESIIDKKRMPVYDHEKVVSLGDIAIYTDGDDKPLSNLLEEIKVKQNAALIEIDYKKASKAELEGFLESILPNFDHDRVYPSDIRKIIQWYNLLINNGITDFHDETSPQKEEEPEVVAEEPKEEAVTEEKKAPKARAKKAAK